MENIKITSQQIKLLLGIVELQKCYSALEELDFSDDLLNELYEIIEDLKQLKESE